MPVIRQSAHAATGGGCRKVLPASAIAAASTAVLAETYGIVRILLY
eukprot:COSAG01_NODE_77877_length_156_cov_23.964912_1_plen_45_part_01